MKVLLSVSNSRVIFQKTNILHTAEAISTVITNEQITHTTNEHININISSIFSNKCALKIVTQSHRKTLYEDLIQKSNGL